MSSKGEEVWPPPGDEYKNIYESAKELVRGSMSAFFEKLADSVAGTAEELRDGSEFDPVELPRDLYAHSGSQTEWWYYTGHAVTSSGRPFGFELVFFKRRTDLDKFNVVPLRLLGNPIYFAHFAVTDISEGTFKYAHRKSSNSPLDYPAAASESHYFLRIGDWTARESKGAHLLQASLNGGLSFQATLIPRKEAVLHGPKSDGVSMKDVAQASRYFAYTRMELHGELEIGGIVEEFTGSAWMDREFGTWAATDKQKGWDWFSIQLDDANEVVVYHLRDGKGRTSEFSCGMVIHPDGQQDYLSQTEFEIVPTGHWTSPHSGATYPSGWEIKIPEEDILLVVEPVLRDQELDTRGTTMIVYWEGACKVEGSLGGSSVTGNAYVELVGYDRSHDAPNLAHFLWGSHFESSSTP